jgi:PAS domain S-box-containing protein
VIELSRYVFEVLRKDNEFILYRGRSEDDPPQVLVLSPAIEYPPPQTLNRLEHEYSLREALDPRWAARPMAMARHGGRTVVVLEDPGGVPLDQLGGGSAGASRYHSSDPGFCLRVAISLANAIGHLHQRGLIHKDLKPANVLVEAVTGQCWLRGFGIASRLPRERQVPKPPEFIAGTLAYMAPEQTGRMNRSIDSRSDLYSLGVTLYELLTGSLPFMATDPLEWVHCHIARQPVPPAELSKHVPAVVSAIVIKLLAKTPEERYQTAVGAQGDLQRCLSEWETRGRIEEFPLGEHDAPDRLLIPEKLYGRAREIETLLASFDRVVAGGTSELVLVSGYSGVGKSSVVQELHKALVPRRGLFASGKFDQYKRDIPYATLAQAFQGLIRPLLGKTEAELSDWRDALREALGLNGLLMVDLVPELKLIIGEQPPVPVLPPREAQGRFRLVFRRFVDVFARPEHPLALFLDDLQWLDAATLDFLEHLLTQADVHHLMLIGAYRDNDVDSAHPLWRKLEAIRQAGARVHEIVLAPLICEDLGRLLVDSLRCESARVAPLAQLVHEKTASNPFFVIQFLHTLVEENLLALDHVKGQWFWDLDRIHAKGYTDNVVELMVGKLNRLPVKTQKALQELACLGNSAEIATLSIVHGRVLHSQDAEGRLVPRSREGEGGTPEHEVHSDLWEAVRLELIVRLEHSYKFVHDRVQEAAYSLITQQLLAETHLRVGRLLWKHLAPEKSEEGVFEIVNQLDRGAALITSRDEREQLAELNLIAGKRAKATTAYASGLKYLIAGAALLADDRWERRRELAFALELHRAECEFLTSQPAAAEERLIMLSSRAANTVELATVTCLRVDLYTTLDQSDRAVAVCLDYLRRLGVDWSPHPTEAEARREYELIWSQLGGRAIEELLELPLMSDPVSLATLDVLTKVLAPANHTDANLFSLVTCRAVNLSLEGGNCDGSCFTYVTLGMVAGPHFGDYQAAFRFGRLGYQLVERSGLERFQAGTYMLFAMHVMPWTRHIRAGRDLVRRAFEAADRIGDLTFAAYSCVNLNTNLLAAGDPLVEVQREAENCLAFAQKARVGHVIDIITAQLGLIRTLRGLTPAFGSFDDGPFDELQFERHLLSKPALTLPECWYWIRKLQARFFAGDYGGALEASSRAQRLLWTSPSMFETAEYHFYGALSQAASCESAAAGQRRQQVEALVAHHRQLENWAENCPENFENRAALVGAEIARLDGRDIDAMRLYEQAIRSARENGFVHHEALANELAARFYAARGFEKIALAYLRDARYGYLRWEAAGKVRQLDELYPRLREEGPTPGPTSTMGAPIEQLDFAPVIKVSHAVSGEIVLEKLIDTLMRTAIEHAGAQRGLLILLWGDQPQIEAEATTGPGSVAVTHRRTAVTPSELPQSALQYVIRTQESVLLDDALVGNLFSEDAYVQERRPRSVLCLPLVKQAKLIGVLYLENTLAPRVFTPARLAVLELLGSQASISLQNARLYAEVTRENRDRKHAEEALRASEQRLQDIVDHTTAIIFVKDLDLRYVLINREYERRYQVQRDQIRGKTDFDVLPHDIAAAVRDNDRQVIETGLPIQFEETVPSEGGEHLYVAAKFLLRDHTGKPYAVCGIATEITALKRAEEMQAALARERELFAQQRATELAKANEVLRGSLDALASVPELDFLGQVMATITRQLDAVSSSLRVLNREQNTLELKLILQDGLVMSPVEANYPQSARSLSPDEQRAAAFLDQPTTVIHIRDPHSQITEEQRSYLLGLGIKTLLIIPLSSGGQINGRLDFRFKEERTFDPEMLEIARALATQASLAIQLTRFAETARQSAVLEERNRMAGEIHDSLAQFFTGISMQLDAAKEVLKKGDHKGLSYLERAAELAQFGLAEARRSAYSLQPSLTEGLGLAEALQKLVERSNVPGRLRGNFHASGVPEGRLPRTARHELLLIAQEAISNAVRHAKPTVINVSVRGESPNLVLEVTDNGSGIAEPQLAGGDSFGLSSMRARAESLGARFDVRTAPGRGTSIVVRLPLP